MGPFRICPGFLAGTAVESIIRIEALMMKGPES
jgi:hypothetical protein